MSLRTLNDNAFFIKISRDTAVGEAGTSLIFHFLHKSRRVRSFNNLFPQEGHSASIKVLF